MPSTNYWPQVWNDLRGCVRNAWPEVEENFRDFYIRRINWANLIEAGILKTPYVVIHCIPPGQEMDLGLNNVAYRISTCLVYVAQEDVSLGPSETGIIERVEIQMKRMQDELLNPTIPFQAIQVWEGFRIDTSADNQVNSSVLMANMQMFGAEMYFDIIVGEVLDLHLP